VVQGAKRRGPLASGNPDSGRRRGEEALDSPSLCVTAGYGSHHGRNASYFDRRQGRAVKFAGIGVLPHFCDSGVWQRFATNWAIVFTSSSQSPVRRGLAFSVESRGDLVGRLVEFRQQLMRDGS
jgi:hypothetical protein